MKSRLFGVLCAVNSRYAHKIKEPMLRQLTTSVCLLALLLMSSTASASLINYTESWATDGDLSDNYSNAAVVEHRSGLRLQWHRVPE